MIFHPDIDRSEVADEWASRSEFWKSEIINSKPKRRRRERNSTPLILCGHGVSLRIENGTLVIRDGFTHYPQVAVKYRYFPGSREIPTRILLLDGSGTLSFDVLSWLGEQQVALARVKWTGEIAAVASGSGFASDQAKVQWQHETRADEAKRLEFAADLIQRKLIRSIATLQRHFRDTPLRAATIRKLNSRAERIGSERFRELNDIRALEGECASRYFDAWRELEIKWAGMGRKPIPDDWRLFTMRSSLANGIKAYNYSASHPLNAMLNYGYAVKLAQLQLQAIGDGYDPTIGVMHHARRGKPAFALDLIEPERPCVDSTVLSLIQSNGLHAADFVLRADGVCRLSPQLARAVATAVA